MGETERINLQLESEKGRGGICETCRMNSIIDSMDQEDNVNDSLLLDDSDEDDVRRSQELLRLSADGLPSPSLGKNFGMKDLSKIKLKRMALRASRAESAL